MTKQPAIVTAQNLNQMLQDPVKRQHVIGRALVALFRRQTEAERQTNDTRVWNTVGFSGADARRGSLTAKYYLKHKSLLDWQVEQWMRPARNGLPRLCKYTRQLNEIAIQRANQG
jgi:hypothetical protein